MAMPTISVNDRKVVLLSGFDRMPQEAGTPRGVKPHVVIRDEKSLIRSVENDNDAVAFGYVHGRWVAVA